MTYGVGTYGVGIYGVGVTSNSKVYVTAEELRDQLGDAGSRLGSAQLDRAANAASRAVDRYCYRRFWRDVGLTTRLFRVDDPIVVWVDDISSRQGVVVKTDDDLDGTFGTTWSADEYQLEPLNADGYNASDTPTPYAFWRISAVGRGGLAARIFPYSDRRAVLSVTARFGWSAVPDDVAEATMLLATRLFRRKDVPFGIAAFGDSGVVRIGRQDGDAAGLLEPYRRKRPRTLTYAPQRTSIFHGGGW
jgi:hypothetical protein